MASAVPRLKDRVAVVTGAATGIGGATARRLAEEGARVLIVDLDEPAAAANVGAIRDAGGTADALVADVGTIDGVRATIDRATGQWGRLDIVVNNAYPGPMLGDAVNLSEADWDRAMDVGLKAMFRSAKFAVPHLRQAGGGNIVNISSVHGLLAAPGWLAYETLKTAVIGLTRQLATDYGPDGIRVNAICPGHILTERIQAQWQDHPEGLRFFEQQYPLRRCGRPVDIANAVVFLCSEEASFITGHTLVVDGGLTVQLQENLGVHLARYAQQNDTWFPY
jgi:NAD(P)-dependent dehydrogenase (short-subunit alcohol dehydrogenase family)